MTVDACAEMLQRGDPDRFAAVMAAPVAAREVLFPLYAWNLEVARAPWVTKEPLIAEMRLQWWRDVVENAASGAARAHEVAGPLHRVIQDRGLSQGTMDRLIAARRADILAEPFSDGPQLHAYLEDTGAGLMWLAGQALGAEEGAQAAFRAYGWAAGLANYLRAVPDLIGRGRRPLPDPSADGIVQLARMGQARLATARQARSSIQRGAVPALLAGWQTEATLAKALRDPDAVLQGGLQLPEFSRRGRLLWQALSGRW